MTSIIPTGAVGDHPHGSFQRDAEPPPEANESAPAAQAQPAGNETDVRLFIEDDQASGGFIYKTVDRRTGAVIRQLPLDGVLQLGAAPDYAAGALIRARA